MNHSVQAPEGHEPYEGGWLASYLALAVREGVCTRIFCTTCGALGFRRGLLERAAHRIGRPDLQQFNPAACVEILNGLAVVPRGSDRADAAEAAVRCVLFDVWRCLGDADFDLHAASLRETWAGEVLERMRAHHRARLAARCAYAEANSPERIKQRRAEKREQRQRQHAERMALQRDRGRAWHEEHGGGNAQ
jgi:hypothetical protein